VAVFFIHKRILFMLLFRTPGFSFVVQACLVLLLLGEQDRAARRHSECEKYVFYAEWKVEEM